MTDKSYFMISYCVNRPQRSDLVQVVEDFLVGAGFVGDLGVRAQSFDLDELMEEEGGIWGVGVDGIVEEADVDAVFAEFGVGAVVGFGEGGLRH